MRRSTATIVVMIGVSLLAGCATTTAGSTGVSAEQTAQAEPSGTAAPTTTTTTIGPGPGPQLKVVQVGFDDDECLIERIAVEVGLQAYSAQTGSQAASAADLIGHRLYDSSLPGVDVVDGEIVRAIDGEDCLDSSGLLALMPQACFESAMRLMAAVTLYGSQNGTLPIVPEDITEAGFHVEQTDYEFDGVSVVPLDSSACPDVNEIMSEETAEMAGELCSTTRKTLAIATEVYAASTGMMPSVEQDLVDSGMLRTLIDEYDVVITGDTFEIVAVDQRCIEAEAEAEAGADA